MARNLTREEAQAMRAKATSHGGRKTRTEEEEIKKELERAIPETEVLQALAALCRSRWADQRIRAITLYLAYKWGKPVERQEISGPEGGPIEFAGLSDAELEREIAAAVGRIGNGEALPLVPPCPPESNSPAR